MWICPTQGGPYNSCGKASGLFSVDCLTLLPKQPIQINSNDWWGMACPLQRQTKWKTQSHHGIGFRTEQPQMRKTGLATKTAVYLQLGRVVTDKTFLHSFFAPPLTPSALPCFLPLHCPEKNKSESQTREAFKAEHWYVTLHAVQFVTPQHFLHV